MITNLLDWEITGINGENSTVAEFARYFCIHHGTDYIEQQHLICVVDFSVLDYKMYQPISVLM